MPLHLVKLCVGVDAVEQLTAWRNQVAGRSEPTFHVTRMAPKRKDEILDGGSLYWVIKHVIKVRQSIIKIEEFRDLDGIKRCKIWLGPELVRTAPAPRRPFQGWRYLKPEDAPADLTKQSGGEDLPDELRRKLIELGAW